MRQKNTYQIAMQWVSYTANPSWWCNCDPAQHFMPVLTHPTEFRTWAKPNIEAFLVHLQSNTDMIKTSSQRCLKRLLEEPPDNMAKRKPAPQVPHPPTTGLSPFLGTRNPSPKSNQSKAPSRVGQYTLVERYEGEEVYRAEHSQTKKQFTCQVLQKY